MAAPCKKLRRFMSSSNSKTGCRIKRAGWNHARWHPLSAPPEPSPSRPGPVAAISTGSSTGSGPDTTLTVERRRPLAHYSFRSCDCPLFYLVCWPSTRPWPNSTTGGPSLSRMRRAGRARKGSGGTVPT